MKITADTTAISTLNIFHLKINRHEKEYLLIAKIYSPNQYIDTEHRDCFCTGIFKSNAGQIAIGT